MKETETLQKRTYYEIGVEDEEICDYTVCGCVIFRPTKLQVCIRLKDTKLAICKECYSYNITKI